MGKGFVRDRLVDGQRIIQIKEKGANCHKKGSLPATNILNEKKDLLGTFSPLLDPQDFSLLFGGYPFRADFSSAIVREASGLCHEIHC
jgi:hypothetical protein